jgi:hypothetical protein
MINLADTSIRLYRKKDGKVSVKLRSYLIIESNIGFKLSAYLKHISVFLTLSNNKLIELNEISFSDEINCKLQLNTMVHDFWASGITEMSKIENSVGILRLNYWLNFTGHPTEEAYYLEYKVPIIGRSTIYG